MTAMHSLRPHSLRPSSNGSDISCLPGALGPMGHLYVPFRPVRRRPALESLEQPYRVETDGTVRFEYSRMERGRPYPFQIGDRWLIAVLEPGESQASIYYFPEND